MNLLSEAWYEIIKTMAIPEDGVIVEFAPGFKSKIGEAAALMDFCGEYHLIEPNAKAFEHSFAAYKKILPKAKVIGHQKYLADLEIGKDIPDHVDALLANHAPDDVVLALANDPKEVDEFFSMDSSPDRVKRTKELWDVVERKGSARFVDEAARMIIAFTAKLNPGVIALSHYEGKTLTKNNILLPNEVGNDVIHMIQKAFGGKPRQPYSTILRRSDFGSHWVIRDYRTHRLEVEIEKEPRALKRLNPDIFCKENARKLAPSEYDVVYTNNDLLVGLGFVESDNQAEINKIIGECFAYRLVTDEDVFEPQVHSNFQVLGSENFLNGKSIFLQPDHENLNELAVQKHRLKTVYADRQADPTDIALSGNQGSGRACYIGSDFNIKGIGRTHLATAPKDSLHGTGTLDLITALREALVSNFLYDNTKTGTSPVLAVIALKEKDNYPWSDGPVRNALLVRLDRGSLDRISHAVYAPLKRRIHFSRLVEEFAVFDAEMFARRIFHGAWSTGNSSFRGQWLDIESVSLVAGRGARCNITKKYISNYFGYESIGIKQALDQLAELQSPKEKRAEWEPLFDEARKERLQREFLQLVGLGSRTVTEALVAFPKEVAELCAQFEKLAKKISPRKANLNVFGNDFDGTHLLDFSQMFRRLPDLHEKGADEMRAALVREGELAYCKELEYTPENKAEEYLAANAVVSAAGADKFMDEVKQFTHALVLFIGKLKEAGYLPAYAAWRKNVMMANREYPNFEQVNRSVRELLAQLEAEKISADELNRNLKGILGQSCVDA